MVPRARLINHFFKKKTHFFKKSCFFGHTQIQNQALRWDQKMDPKTCPNSGKPLRKYIEIHETWLKMVLLRGPILTPRANPILTLKRPSPFQKKIFKNRKNNSKDCDIWNFIAAVIDTDTNARYRTFIFFSQTTVRVSFSSPPAGLKIDTFGGPFFDKFLAKNCLWRKIGAVLNALRGTKNEPPLEPYTAHAFTTNHWHTKPGRFENYKPYSANLRFYV